MSALFERRNILREAMRTTQRISASTMKTIHSVERGFRHSVDQDIDEARKIYERLLLGIKRIDR